jgi:hypothetical protein
MVGDGFFEAEIFDESVYESGLTLSENGEFYLVTEAGNPLNHDV